MEIRIRPEVEELIRQDVQTGAYDTVENYIEHAVSLLHEQEAWLAAHREEVRAKIEEGYTAAQSGILIDADDVRARLNLRKKTWLDEQRRG
jgi:putative addiction module CopG family antidote